MAIKRDWGAAEAVWAVVSLALALAGWVASENPRLEETVGNLGWQIPLLGFALLGVSRVVLAPYWIFKEKEQKLSSLREKLGAELRLDIEAFGVQRIPTSIWPPEGENDGWLIQIRNVRITNRSRVDRVSLKATLCPPVRTSELPEGYSIRYIIEEGKFSGLGKKDYPHLTYLREPIRIDPQQSVAGALGFVVDEREAKEWDNGIDDLMTDGEMTLVLKDHVSKESKSVTVPTRGPDDPPDID